MLISKAFNEKTSRNLAFYDLNTYLQQLYKDEAIKHMPIYPTKNYRINTIMRYIELKMKYPDEIISSDPLYSFIYSSRMLNSGRIQMY